MYRVGIIGPESSGKSTLATYLAKRYQGVYVAEYARDYVEKKSSRDITFDELCTIAQHQIEQLTTINPDSDKVYFFDTELIVTKVWFEYAFKKTPCWLNDAIIRNPMDVYLLTYPDLPWIPDSARYNGSEEIRHALYERYKQEIEQLDIPYYIIRHT